MASRRTPDSKPSSKSPTNASPTSKAGVGAGSGKAPEAKTAKPVEGAQSSGGSSRKGARGVAKPAPVTVPPAAATEVAASPPMEPPAAATAPPVRRAATPKPKARTALAARPVVTPDMRRGMIAEAAYLRSEKRGFAPGYEEADWLAAEIEVDRLLGDDSGSTQ
jgi:hypothetical protein